MSKLKSRKVNGIHAFESKQSMMWPVEGYDGAIHYHQSPKRVATQEFALFEKLLVEWGKAAFREDGEDSSGRAKGARMSVEELLADCEMATKKFFEVCNENEWLEDAPPFKTLMGAAESNRKINRRN